MAHIYRIIMFKMKSLIYLFLLLCSTVFAQEVDLCRYVYLDVDSREEYGQVIKSYSPEVDTSGTDSLTSFLRSHYNRFGYLLENKLGDLSHIVEVYPDSVMMDSLMCKTIRQNALFRLYFNNLLPGIYRYPDMQPDTFSTEELMLVASHFFYCLEIEESDTSVVSHVCVHKIEREFIPFERDATLLEAFAFEGITYALLHEDNPQFDANFKRYINESRDRFKDTAGDLNELLISVRHQCFTLMESDEDLKTSLLRYYNLNRDNLHFILTGS